MNRETSIRKRKYSEEFLKYGFTFIVEAGIEKPKCVICNKIMSAESMKPNKMKCHFKANHPNFAGKDVQCSKNKADGVKKRRLDFGGKYQHQNMAAIEASYFVALRIAKAKKPHTIAEELLLPATKDIVRVMLGAEYANKLNTISLSNNTVSRRIDDMSDDKMEQVIQEMKSAALGIFSIQLDESTDVANCFQLLVYVRHIYEGDFKDELLFCKPLEITTTAYDVFDTVGSFLQNHDIPWGNVCGVCTDGAPAMLGCRSGFQRLVINASPKAIGTHCMIHRQVLATKTLPQEFQDIMKSVVSVVNFVKTSASNSRLFSKLCSELGASNNVLLFHTDVRWLSRSKVLTHVFDLCDELKTFSYQKSKPQFKALFGDKNQLNKIAYMVDIFAILNELNLSLQGPNTTCLDLSEKNRTFQLKLQLLQKKLDENRIYMLSNLSVFFEENDIEQETMNRTILSVKEHIKILEEEISRYFPNLPDTPFALARSPFAIRVEDVPENAQEEFIELITSDAAKTDLSSMSVTKFWIKRWQSYPVLSEITLRLILPFPTTYLCETGFSSLLVIKSKYRSRLVAENDVLCSCKDCSKDFRSGEKEASTPFSLTLFGFCNFNFFVVKI